MHEPPWHFLQMSHETYPVPSMGYFTIPNKPVSITLKINPSTEAILDGSDGTICTLTLTLSKTGSLTRTTPSEVCGSPGEKMKIIISSTTVAWILQSRRWCVDFPRCPLVRQLFTCQLILPFECPIPSGISQPWLMTPDTVLQNGGIYWKLWRLQGWVLHGCQWNPKGSGVSASNVSRWKSEVTLGVGRLEGWWWTCASWHGLIFGFKMDTQQFALFHPETFCDLELTEQTYTIIYNF